MLTYEQQTEKLLSKRQAVLDRIESDKAEIEKINAKLKQESTAESDTDTAQNSDESELIGQTSFFDEKPFKD